MKITDLARPSWGTMALAALAGTTAGFVAGYVVGRDPEAARRAAGRATQWAAIGFEQATLWAAQLREHIGDLWAEAREASMGAVDAADFERQAATAAAAAAAVSADSTPARTQAASKRRAKPDVGSKARTRPRTAAKAGAKAPERSGKAAAGPERPRASRRKVEAAAV